MILALSVMLITSLLLVAGYAATTGDIKLSHIATLQKQAYYAALAGVQEFEYQMQANPDYWEKCESPTSLVPEESNAHYEVTILAASTAPSGVHACSTSNPFKSVIQSSGAEANTFRVESVGTAGKIESTKCAPSICSKRAIVATFRVTGFLNFVYFTNHEIEDPELYAASKTCSEPKKWYPETSSCEIIQFATGDVVKGPMHTNDAVCVGGSATFGREGHSPLDVVEFYRGLNASCHGTAKYNTSTGSYIKGESLEPPESDQSLETYVLEENEFIGVTHLVLNGTTNKIEVTNAKFHGGTPTPIPWPSNGLIWIRGTSGEEAEEVGSCNYKFEPHSADNLEEHNGETYCGDVYVSGTYSQSLTIGSDDNVIIDGSIYPTSVASSLGSEPSGSETLGLIANNYVRIYHPVKETYAGTGTGGKTCKGHDQYNSTLGECEYTNNATEGCDAPNENASEDPNKVGSLISPWIYAAILSTQHSFAVDNFNCGAKLENLNVYGAIAQNYRGIVGTSGNTGYIKNYNYDDRIAVDEPPYFLSPLKAGWKIARETAPTGG
jgi:hypothetical protein